MHRFALRRQGAGEFVAGEPLRALSKRHGISRQLIRIWAGTFEAGAPGDDAQAADLIQGYEAKIAALQRMAGRQALKPELLKGALKHAPGPRRAIGFIVIAPRRLRRPGTRADGTVPLDRLRRRTLRAGC